MLVNDLFRLSFHNLLLHKIRSFLTSLGIIFGVGSVIAMLAISEGAKKEALAQIEALGVNNIIVSTLRPSASDSSGGTDQGSITMAFGLTKIDLKNIKKMDNIDHVTTLRNARKKVLKGLKQVDVKLISCDIEFLKDASSSVTLGRWLSQVDSFNKTNYCVIGENVKRKIFSLSKESVIGRKIKIEDSVFSIVGVLENDHGTLISDLGSPNDMIFIPIGTSEVLYGAYAFQREGMSLKISDVDYDVFLVRVKDIEFIDDTAKRIKGYLKKSHGQVADWSIFVPLDLLKQKEQTQNIFTIVMGSIASISLVVGGIGIMNIMLANVYERRKEIGTRRALGAKKRDILYQFLIETIFLTVIGGGIGICLGMGLSWIINYYVNWPTTFSMWSILFSFIISAVVGVVFGTYPAWKAAQQNPIDVLRAE